MNQGVISTVVWGSDLSVKIRGSSDIYLNFSKNRSILRFNKDENVTGNDTIII